MKTARRLSAAALAALALAVAGHTLTGCNTVRWQQQRLAARMHEAGLRDRTERLGDATVRFWEGGRGPALLLVHGFGAEALWQWTEQAEAFSGARRLVIPDLLWFGGSSSSERDYSLGHQVRMLVSLLDRLGERQVDVVGISYGGLAAYELAARHPGRVRKLVLVDSPGCEYSRRDYDALLQRFGCRSAAELFVPTDEGGIARLMSLAYEKPPWAPSFARRQALAELYSSWREEKAALLGALVEALQAGPRCEEAPSLPTLLVWGREDPVFPLELGQRLGQRLGPKARLHVIDSARHAPNLEHPDEFDRVVKAFLDGP